MSKNKYIQEVESPQIKEVTPFSQGDTVLVKVKGYSPLKVLYWLLKIEAWVLLL